MKYARFLILMILVIFSLSLLAAEKMYTGYISDCACGIPGKDPDGNNLTMTPWKHTLACMKLDSCMESGYGIFIPSGKKMFAFYKFDPKGSDMAKMEIIEKTKKTSNIMVKVKGMINEKDKMMTISSISMYTPPKTMKKAAKPMTEKK
jgi:hypothetical protein